MIPKTITLCEKCNTPRNKPKMTLELCKRKLRATKTAQVVFNNTAVRKSKRDRSRNPADTSTLNIPKSNWSCVEGLQKALVDVRPAKDDIEKMMKEKFSKAFSMWDVRSVCNYGWFTPDNVVYTLGTHFVSKGQIPLFLEDPSFIGSVVDLETLKVNHDGLGLLQMQNKSNLTWGARLEEGERVLLPVCYPKDDHWMLVVLSQVRKRVYIKVWDP